MQIRQLHRGLLLMSLIVGAVMATVSLLGWSATAVADTQPPAATASSAFACVGDNLLTNPGFEGDYIIYEYPPPGHPDCQTWDASKPNQYCERAKMPAGWHPRWLEDGTEEYIIMPEFTASTPDQINPDRVRSGGKSLHYWSFWQEHEAAVLQQVTAVPGVTYCFSAWGHAWSDRTSDDFYSATPDRPIDDGELLQRVGIDPTGGTDWQATTVIWGDERKQYDLFGEFTISTTAQAEQITVFLYSRTGRPVKHNEAYWDDASLTALTLSADAVSPIIMTTISQTVTRRLTVPIQISNPAYTWTTVLNPASTFTPTLSAPSGLSGENLVITTTTAGLTTGAYSATVTIATSQPALGSPTEIPFNVYVVDDIFPAYLPAIMRP